MLLIMPDPRGIPSRQVLPHMTLPLGAV